MIASHQQMPPSSLTHEQERQRSTMVTPPSTWQPQSHPPAQHQPRYYHHNHQQKQQHQAPAYYNPSIMSYQAPASPRLQRAPQAIAQKQNPPPASPPAHIISASSFTDTLSSISNATQQQIEVYGSPPPSYINVVPNNGSAIVAPVQAHNPFASVPGPTQYQQNLSQVAAPGTFSYPPSTNRSFVPVPVPPPVAAPPLPPPPVPQPTPYNYNVNMNKQQIFQQQQQQQQQQQPFVSSVPGVQLTPMAEQKQRQSVVSPQPQEAAPPRPDYITNSDYNGNNIPQKHLIKAQGHILSRLSLRSIHMNKQWKETYWIQYGTHRMYWFRSEEDFKEWATNPYLTPQQRQYLVKLEVDFLEDLNKPGVRGYQVTPVTSKTYKETRGATMPQFKLERWMQYTGSGAKTIAGAFGSRQHPNEVDTLREVMLSCLRHVSAVQQPKAARIHATGAVRDSSAPASYGHENDSCMKRAFVRWR